MIIVCNSFKLYKGYKIQTIYKNIVPENRTIIGQSKTDVIMVYFVIEIKLISFEIKP